MFGFKSKETIGTWNVRGMYRGKLEIVKAEMDRLGVQLLGISALRWTGSGQFESGVHRVIYSGGSSSRYGVAIICNKRMSNAILGFNPIRDRIMTAASGKYHQHFHCAGLCSNSRCD